MSELSKAEELYQEAEELHNSDCNTIMQPESTGDREKDKNIDFELLSDYDLMKQAYQEQKQKYEALQTELEHWRHEAFIRRQKYESREKEFEKLLQRFVDCWQCDCGVSYDEDHNIKCGEGFKRSGSKCITLLLKSIKEGE